MATLLLLTALAGTGVEVRETEVYLWPDGLVYELEAPAAEVRLVFAFRFGLYAVGERGQVAAAAAPLFVDYNDADRSTCYWNRYRPLPFDAEANPQWTGRDDMPGLFVTEGATTELAERTLVLRFPRVNRWRVRVTPVEADAEGVRRVPTLVQVAELRDAKPREFEELDPLPEPEEPPAAEEEVEVPAEEEIVEEVAVEEVAIGEVVAGGAGAAPCVRPRHGCRERPPRRDRGPANGPPLHRSPSPKPAFGGGEAPFPPPRTLPLPIPRLRFPEARSGDR